MIPLQTASPHPVSHIVFGPDGATVAVAQPHYGVTLLERATGRTLAVCAMPRRGFLTGLAFCGEGKYLAASHWKGLEVFDTTTGARALANFHYPQGYQLAVRGDAVLGAAPTNYTALRPLLKVTDTIAPPEPTKSLLYRSDLTPVACAPDGSHVLSADRGRFVLLNAVTDRTVAEIERPADENRPAAPPAKFCPLGRRFAINDGHTLDVYAAGVAEEDEDEQPADAPLVQRGNSAPMPHVLLAPTFALKPDKPGEAGNWYPPFALLVDGRGLLVKRPRNRVQLWDTPTCSLVNEWSWRFEWVTCVAASTDGLTAVAGGRFGRLLLWDLE
jgi:hypothetical protein